MAKNVNKKSDKKKNNPPAKKSQGHKIVVQKGGVAFIANDVDDSNFIAGNENLVNSKEQKVSKKSKSVKFSSKGEIPEVGDLPLGSHLPFSPNALFTGREKELKKLADSILGESKTNTVITQAVVGMGGLGKTQLAVEFGYRYGKYFRGVHWINLADVTQLDSEIANCGRQMFPHDFPEDQPSQVALTLQIWKTNGPNLLILDNFEEPSKASDIFTKLRHSNICILVTSRRTDWSATLGLTQLPLDLFTEEESLQFLKDSLTNRKDSEEDLKKLAERLGHLPLGLELASRYLKDKRLSIKEYLEQTENALEHASMKNWRADMPAATGHDLDLQRTFALSWGELKDETPQKMFTMAGYLAPNTSIPLEIFERALEISLEKCDESLNVLYGLGLFKKGEDNLPAIHPLLAEFAQGLAKEHKEILETLSIALGNLANEANDTGIPANFLPIRPHIPVLATHVEDEKLKKGGWLWNSYGTHLKDIADYNNAQIAYEKALSIKKSLLGENHQDTATTLNDLGNLFKIQSDYTNAKKCLEEALQIYEKVLGKEHSWVATAINNLGGVLEDLGDLHGAKTMYERALKIFVANLGEKHPNVAICVNNLGSVLQALGDLHGAKALYERALKIDEANFGTEHPNVAVCVGNLGRVLQALGDLHGAKEMLERALKIGETNFGTEHPKVAIRVNNLGSVLKDLGDLHGAKTMYERALKIFVANLGEEHPNVATLVNNLGSVLKDLGDLHGAKIMYERALNIFKKFLPADHPNIKVVQGNLDLLKKS